MVLVEGSLLISDKDTDKGGSLVYGMTSFKSSSFYSILLQFFFSILDVSLYEFWSIPIKSRDSLCGSISK